MREVAGVLYSPEFLVKKHVTNCGKKHFDRLCLRVKVPSKITCRALTEISGFCITLE